MTNNEKKKKNNKPSTSNKTELNSFASDVDYEHSERSQERSRSSLSKFKNDLEMVLDLMGPDTPQFQNSSSEADNDTSLQTVSGVNEHKTMTEISEASVDEVTQDATAAPESVLTSATDSKNTSILVELPSSQSQRNYDTSDLCDEYQHMHNQLHYPHMSAQPVQSTVPLVHNIGTFLDGHLNTCYEQQGNNRVRYHFTHPYEREPPRKRKGFLGLFGYKPAQCQTTDLYKIKCKPHELSSLPRRLTFELADESNKNQQPCVESNQIQKPLSMDQISGKDQSQYYTCTNTYCPHTLTVSQDVYCPRIDSTYCKNTHSSDRHTNCYNPRMNSCSHNVVQNCSDRSCPYNEEYAEPNPLSLNPNCSLPYQTFPNPNSCVHEEMYQNCSQFADLNEAKPCKCSQKNSNTSQKDHTSNFNRSAAQHSSATNMPTLVDGVLRGNLKRNVGQNFSARMFSQPEIQTKISETKQKTTCEKTPNAIYLDQSDDCIKCRKKKCSCSNINTVKVFGRSSSCFGITTNNQESQSIYDIIDCNNANSNQNAIRYYDTSGATRVDVYYFDHGNAEFYRTTDITPAVATETIAQKTEAYTLKFWAEVFGTVHIGFAFVTSFILQLFRFLLYSLLRPILIGTIQLSSDYCLKPSLSTCFNSIIQPVLIFLYNIASSFRDLCDPVAEAIGYYIRELGTLIRSIRLVEINQNKKCGSK